LREAAIRVGDVELQSQVAPDAPYAEFTLDLNAGETRLQTFLMDADGTTIGAYYVYVERLP
jgi:hypothetical protein